MRRIKITLTAVCAATLLTAAITSAQGTLADRKTVVAVSGPMSIPGATLPAGTYVFKIIDSPANRHIVQIFDREEAKLIATLLAVPAERAEADGEPLITFKETPSDRPPAVRYWYYAGEKSGNEFVYPKAQAMMIASASGESVSAVDTDATDIEAWKKSEVSRVTANAEPQSTTSTATTTTQPTTTAPVTPEPTPAPTPTPETPMAPPAAVTSAPSITAGQPEPVGTSGRTEALPRTASELPAVGLIGWLALAAAFGVRAARRALA
jgi:hypothetical protein